MSTTKTGPLTAADLGNLKWDKFQQVFDSDSHRFQSLEGLRASENPHGHGVQVFADRVRENWIGGRTWTQYRVLVSGGPYGETCDHEKMPKGTTLAMAKDRAVEIATVYATQGMLSI